MKGTPFKTTLQVTIPFEVALWLKAQAEKHNVSVNDIVRKILDQAVEANPKDEDIPF